MYNFDINWEVWDDIPQPMKFGIVYIRWRVWQHSCITYNMIGVLLTETGIFSNSYVSFLKYEATTNNLIDH